LWIKICRIKMHARFWYFHTLTKTQQVYDRFHAAKPILFERHYKAFINNIYQSVCHLLTEIIYFELSTYQFLTSTQRNEVPQSFTEKEKLLDSVLLCDTL